MIDRDNGQYALQRHESRERTASEPVNINESRSFMSRAIGQAEKTIGKFPVTFLTAAIVTGITIGWLVKRKQ